MGGGGGVLVLDASGPTQKQSKFRVGWQGGGQKGAWQLGYGQSFFFCAEAQKLIHLVQLYLHISKLTIVI